MTALALDMADWLPSSILAMVNGYVNVIVAEQELYAEIIWNRVELIRVDAKGKSYASTLKRIAIATTVYFTCG